MTAHERHPADVVRILFGGLIFVALGVSAHLNGVRTFERDLFHVINDLPDALHIPLELVMQLGTFAAIFVVAGGALIARARWMALCVALSGLAAYYTAMGAKTVVGRGRPTDVLAHVVVRGPHVSGYGYPSGHAAVAAAIVTAASPFIPRPARRGAWVAVALVAVARVYVGAHFPLDVIGGGALGWMIGALVCLLLGTPCHEIDPAAVERALRTIRFPVHGLTRVADDGTDAVPYEATTDAGSRVFVKAIDREHRDADALAALGRFVLFRHLADETPFATPRQRVEHEALLAAFAGQQGVHVARPLAIAAPHKGPSVLVLDAIAGESLDESGTKLDDATMTVLWQQVALLRQAHIAHRHLSLNNVMLGDDGTPWITSFAFAVTGATDRELAGDVAELLASLALVSDPAHVVDVALKTLGREPILEALPLLQPLALSTSTRRALRQQHHLLARLRDAAADAVGVEHVKLEPLTRVRRRQVVTLACFLVATYLLLPQVGELNRTFAAMGDAEPAWLALALVASVGTFLAAALSLTGCVLVPLAYGRTFVVQLASSFSNKITPAGIGGMGVNVRYLQRSGVSNGDALGAIALNGSVGFVVHIAALVVSAVLLGKTGLPPFHVPTGWPLLVAITIALALIGIVLETSHGRKHLLLPTERTSRDLLAVIRRPVKALQMFSGAVLVLASYILALGLSLAAFHAHASWIDVATVYLGGSAVASAAPTPGKIGAMEAALIAGITRVGVASGPAVAGVLAFRLATFWLPILPGWLAFRSLAKRELL